MAHTGPRRGLAVGRDGWAHAIVRRVRARSEGPIDAVVQKIAVLGNHVPRQCGIATFTADLSEAIVAEHPEVDCFVLAMNDPGERYAYPPRVRFEIAEGDLGSYRRAADFLNVNVVDVVSLQHEYGIFGGKAGAHVLELLRELRMPIVTTLHTILAEPSPLQRGVMDELAALSERIVVMSATGADLLCRVHGVPRSKIDLIPHGIPTLPAAGQSKDRLGVEGRPVILTFGLLSPDKGIENVIDALPAILREHPDTIYIVLGATHPHVKAHHGEAYRLLLEAQARRLGVDANMIFHNRFVSHEELASSSPPRTSTSRRTSSPKQITSGTLAYAVGSGKAVISTPYWYARELLADGRGILVPWRDPGAIAAEVVGLLGDEARRPPSALRAKAYGRDMVWPAVAKSYVESFERARAEHSSADADRVSSEDARDARRGAARDQPRAPRGVDRRHGAPPARGVQRPALRGRLLPRRQRPRPARDGAHRRQRRARRADRARPLVALPGLREPRVRRRVRALPQLHVVRGASGREACGSEDSHGRALWALGTVVGRAGDPGRAGLGGSLFHAALPAVTALHEPARLGLRAARHRRVPPRVPGRQQRRARAHGAGRATPRAPSRRERPSWPWFEDRLTYCNARLPQALLASGARMGSRGDGRRRPALARWLAALQRAERRLLRARRVERLLRARRARARAFDQQPVDACAMVSACLEAQRVTGDPRWTRARAARVRLVPRAERAAASRSTTRAPAAAATDCTPIA